MRRLLVALKMLTQFGIGPLALYAAYRVGIQTGHYRRLDRALLREAALMSRDPQPLFPLPAPSDLKRTIGPRSTRAMRQAADQVAAGKFRLFGAKPVTLQLAPKPPLEHWTSYELDGSLLSAFLSAPHDVKFLWEPARFGWAYVLACAFHAFGRERYASVFWRYFAKFDQANPPYLGPHWVNGQEVAIRLMALLWCAQVLRAARASTPARLSRLYRSIAEHAARLPSTLVYARSQTNNHLITESAALYLAGTALDHKPWRDLGWRWLNRAIQKQIGPDGEYIQHSTNYHRLMLQAALLVDAARRHRDETWPSATQQALARAAHWLFSRLDPTSGCVPNLGANDGSLILPLSSAGFEDYRPTVQAAARAFLRTSLPTGDWDDLSLWLALPESAHTADSTAYAAEQLRAPNSWARLRASTFKSRLGHMDQLHLDLWWRGLSIAVDPGTYLYNAGPPWDNSLVSSRVHNVVTIDGREQMSRGGRFMVLDWFPAWSKPALAVAADDVIGQIEAGHHGYDRWGVRYGRRVSLLQGSRWRVQDIFRFREPAGHIIRLHWLLRDGEWHLRQRGPGTELRIRLPRGSVRLTLTASSPAVSPLRTTLVRAGKVLHGDGVALPYEGWISPTYGVKLPALSLSVEVRSSGGFMLTTDFKMPD